MGALIFTMLTTWKTGSALVADHRRKINMTMRKFVTDPHNDILRVPGTAIYLASNPNLVPSRLFYNIKHYKVMHEQIIFLHVDNEEVPYITDTERLTVKGLAPGIYSISVKFGFREEPIWAKLYNAPSITSLKFPAIPHSLWHAPRLSIAKGYCHTGVAPCLAG